MQAAAGVTQLDGPLLFVVQALIVLAAPLSFLAAPWFRRYCPVVVVQLLMGVAMGPSVWGALSPQTHEAIFRQDSFGALTGLATVAALLFAFTTGLRFDLGALESRRRGLVLAAVAFCAPAALGFPIGLWLGLHDPGLRGDRADEWTFALSISICASVTALPVLSAILGQMNLFATRLGQTSLMIASSNDALLWLVMSMLLLASVGRGGELSAGLIAAAGLLALILAMVKVVGPAFGRFLARRSADDALGPEAIAAACVLALACGAVTEALGLHYVLGAFICGAALPAAWRRPIWERLAAPVQALLLPFFFVLAGLQTRIAPDSESFVLVFSALCAVSIIGKFGATALAGRLTGLRWPEAAALGALVQTKGLMEVVVLKILLDQRMISPEVFSAAICMALATTLMTMPVARLALGVSTRAGRADAPSVRSGGSAPAGAVVAPPDLACRDTAVS